MRQGDGIIIAAGSVAVLIILALLAWEWTL
jgi:hypothetical protein